MTVMAPPLALGQSVHEVVEALSILPVEERFTESLLKKFDKVWVKVAGELGGFRSFEQELEYKDRGINMLQRIIDNPGPILEKAVKIKQDLPHYWLTEEDDIILCGKVDWLKYSEEDDSVEIIDFKTGKHEEDGKSLQLPIYLLLATNCQKRKIKGASYWYLERDNKPTSVVLPEIDEAFSNVLEIGRKIVLARKLNHLVCKSGGCRHCDPLEKVYRGEGKFVGLSEYHQDIYII